jgi:hypothetical protein
MKEGRKQQRPSRGYVSLGRIAQRLNMLVITCDHCRRRDPYPLSKLIAKYGAGASIEPLQEEIVANCPHKADPTIEAGKACAPLCPDLQKVF